MVSVTERAKEVLSEILIASGAGQGEGLRLMPRPDGIFVLTLDAELPGDQVVEYEGLKVLLIGIEYLRILDGKTIDCEGSEGEAILLVR